MTYTDAELYDRGVETLLASWAEISRGSPAAALLRGAGVAAAVFPAAPERTVYNNALLARGLGAKARRTAIEAMQAKYAAAGIGHYAAWVHDSDPRLGADLEDRGFAHQETTRAMGMSLRDASIPDLGVELGPAEWAAYLRLLDLPPGFLRGADPAAFSVLVARSAGQSVATAMAFDHDGDCGLYNVTTVASARRRGVGTALTAAHLRDALARGCSTASLQSTPMGERVYARLGFRDLGRFFEYVPKAGLPHRFTSSVPAEQPLER
ncbi:MAG TPA: GNAT family N-acetyltransferase [Dermatophilaceae bacterium]|nr:GNAT family N-acetyltransferase [Dermatophilaceae bacterium]